MLTDSKLKSLKAKDKSYKVSDRDGMYALVSPKGYITFRYDYRLNGRRETLTIGKYGADGLSLSEAREQLMIARKKVSDGISPADEKRKQKNRIKGVESFSDFARKYIDDAKLSKSTYELRIATLEREIEPYFGKRRMFEITTEQIRRHCELIKERGAPSTALFVRDLFFQTYKYGIDRGHDFKNPAESIKGSSIATFSKRERTLTPKEINLFFNHLEESETYPVLKQSVKLILYTLVRKGELIGGRWVEVDFNNAIWHIPAERMKARRAHNVYLSRQVLEIFTLFRMFDDKTDFICPSRTNSKATASPSSLNRIVNKTVDRMRDKGVEIENFTIHDLRRTASTLLHESGFNTDWIEKSLAHERSDVRSVYNKAEYADQRREMMQKWADMVDAWIVGDGI